MTTINLLPTELLEEILDVTYDWYHNICCYFSYELAFVCCRWREPAHRPDMLYRSISFDGEGSAQARGWLDSPTRLSYRLERLDLGCLLKKDSGIMTARPKMGFLGLGFFEDSNIASSWLTGHQAKGQ